MIEILVDGASKGNPGLSGAGIVIKKEGEVLEYRIPLGVKTNHEAEFLAVVKALQLCKKHTDKMIALQSDSKLVIDAIEKNYVKNENFKALLEEIVNLGAAFPYFFVKWIPNNQNHHADRLAREAIHMQHKKST